MAECLTWEELDGLLADELAVEDRLRAERHMAVCVKCAAEYAVRRADLGLAQEIRSAFQLDTETADGARARRSSGPPRGGSPTALHDVIEGYEILSEIHRGGQGIVYKAMQKATKRQVAVKVLLEGPYASPRQRSRFEREIDLIGTLRHPHVVTIHDSGMTEDGRHFFAMEYIRGEPLDAYVKRVRLDVPGTLKLFQKIASAIGHAHLHGIVHRDLKPGNIMVDAQGEPHVVDFGLAKSAGSDLAADGSPLTMTGAFMGTLAYASPEQTTGNPVLIDVRTDVYSLGVILYELLTGASPYPVSGRMDEVVRSIHEAQPKRLSQVRRGIPDDVSSIVLKALAKDPAHRYVSASALANDLAAYLAGEPIEAKRASTIYLIRVTAKRHWRKIALSASFLAMGCFALWIALSAHFSKKGREECLNHLREAKEYLLNDETVGEAIELLDDVIRRSSEAKETQLLAESYQSRALAQALSGMNAPLSDKGRFVTKAVDDLKLSHLVLGGKLPDGLRPLQQAPPTSSGVGSQLALHSASQLLFLTGDGRQGGRILDFLDSTSPLGASSGTWISLFDGTPLFSIDHRSITYLSEGDTPARNRSQVDFEAEIHRILLQPVTSVNPLLGKSYDQHIAELLFDPLFFPNKVGECVRNPNMVELFEPLDSMKKYRLILKPNLRWHDDTPLTAKDVQASWEVREDNDPARIAFSGVRPMSDRELEFELNHPMDRPEWLLTFPIVPAAFARMDDKSQSHLAETGNGPYKFESRDEDVITLVRWADYPGKDMKDQNYAEKYIFHVIPNADDRIEALAKGDIDELDLTPGEFMWDVNGSSFDNHVKKYILPDHWRYEYICWNCKSPLFKEATVRRALTQALNLTAIMETRFQGLYEPSRGIYHPKSPAFNDRVQALDYDPVESERLLDEAGWRLADDGKRWKGDTPFEFTLDVSENSTDILSVVENFRGDLARIGVVMEIRVVPARKIPPLKDERGNFDAFVLGVIDQAHPDQASKRWIIDGVKNFGGYKNPEIDKLYDEARVASRSDQNRLYGQIQQIIYKDQPYTFLWWRSGLWALNKRLRGVDACPQGIAGFYPGPRAWWVAKEE